MNYPDNYDTPAFPAGTRIAQSRAATICVAVVMMLIVIVCGMLILVTPASRKQPFLITAENKGAGEWQVVGYEHGVRKITATDALQESLISKFIRARFNISPIAAENDSMWAACSRDIDCRTIGNSSNGTDCTLFCSSTDEVFEDFATIVIPDYQARAETGESWAVVADTMRIRPSGEISANGGTWRVNFTVISRMPGAIPTSMDVIAYVKVARNINTYPATLGFYVADFNAYRLN